MSNEIITEQKQDKENLEKIFFCGPAVLLMSLVFIISRGIDCIQRKQTSSGPRPYDSAVLIVLIAGALLHQ